MWCAGWPPGGAACCRSVRSRFSCASLEARSRGYISMGTQLMWVAEVTARPAPGLGGPGVASPPPRSPSAAVCGRMRRAAGMEVRTPGAWMLLADLDRTGEPVNSVTMRVTESDGALGAVALPAGRGTSPPGGRGRREGTPWPGGQPGRVMRRGGAPSAPASPARPAASPPRHAPPPASPPAARSHPLAQTPGVTPPPVPSSATAAMPWCRAD